MSESTFHREERYIVIKRKDMNALDQMHRAEFSRLLSKIFDLESRLDMPRRDYVVVESDWPEYETVWRMIERRVAGQSPIPETLATLVLGGAFDATELGENDIQPNMKLIEELQQRMVTGTEDVYVELIDRTEFDRVTAERDALQLRLNAADQRIDELTAELATVRQGPCKMIVGDELP